nr:HAD family phosphatase [Bacilli bacterium]
MTKWRLLAVDLDGTLLNEHRQISKVNREWLHKAREQGVDFTFATGRLYPGFVQKFATELAITKPIISLNGSAIWSCEGKLLEFYPLEKSQVHAMYTIAKQHASHYWVCTEKDVFYDDTFAEEIDKHTFAKFGFVAHDADSLAQIKKQLDAIPNLEVTNTHPLNLEVNPQGISKGNALRTLCQQWNIPTDTLITIGDSLNDTSMLKLAGMGVAMGNAQDEVKAIANHITSNNTEDGVAKAIQTIIFSL